MDLIVSFVLFIACMAASLVAGFSMLVPLALGFVLFAALVPLWWLLRSCRKKKF